MPFTTAYSVLASLSCGWSHQVLFGLGAPLRVPALINLGAFFGVGLPVGSLLAYQAHLGVHGLWMGLVLAVGLIVVGQYAYIGLRIDWLEAAKTARERALAKDQAAPASGSSSGHGEGGAPHLRDESDGQGLAAADSAKAAMEM
eukprot:4892684-Prymnesium_polylepis.2